MNNEYNIIMNYLHDFISIWGSSEYFSVTRVVPVAVVEGRSGHTVGDRVTVNPRTVKVQLLEHRVAAKQQDCRVRGGYWKNGR